MTSEGSPYGRLRRALDRGNLLAARSAAAELPSVGLVEALELVLLIAVQEPEKLGPVAVRWQSRYVREAGVVDAAEAHAVLALLLMLGGPRRDTACTALGHVIYRRGLEHGSKLLLRVGDGLPATTVPNGH